MVAKFYCRDYVFYAHVLSTLISALNALYRLIKIVLVHVISKIIVFYHLPTRGRAGVKLGDA
jgi:hypothetical protein